MTKEHMEKLLEKLLIADRQYIANLDKMIQLPNSTPKYKIADSRKDVITSLQNALAIQREILDYFE